MKIEKIKNFNQVILAITGVFGVILLLLGIIVVFSELLENFKYSKRTTITNSLISEERVETLNQENLRLQIISYGMPKLIDTANVVYIIPVSVSTLNKAEAVVEAAYDDGIMGLLDTFGSSSFFIKEGYFKENYFDGLFANLIVYQPVTNNAILLFNERIMLSGVRVYYFKDDILLVFYTAEKDTNKDGLINFQDDKNLCIYSLKTEKMRRISEGTNSITDYQFVENSKDLLVEFSLSQYNDVEFKSYKPQKIMKYEFETEKLTETVPVNIQQQMQNLLEGKKTQ